MKNIKYLITILLFVMINFVIITASIYYKQQNIEQAINQYDKQLKTYYNVFTYYQYKISDSFYNNLLNSTSLQSLFEQYLKTHDQIIKKCLKAIIIKKAKNFKDLGLTNIHLIDSDGKTVVRSDNSFTNFKRVIDTSIDVHRGITSKGFKNNYPILNDNNEVIGRLCLGYNINNLQFYLNEVNKEHFHILLNKKYFNTSKINNITANSVENKDYILSVPGNPESSGCDIGQVIKHDLKLKKDIKQYMSTGKSFAKIFQVKDNYYVMTTIPIKSSINKDVLLWVIMYSKDDFITQIIHSNYIIISFGIFLSFIFLFYVVDLINRKHALNELVKIKTKSLNDLNATLESEVIKRTLELTNKNKELLASQEIARIGTFTIDILNQQVTCSKKTSDFLELDVQEFGFNILISRIHLNDRNLLEKEILNAIQSDQNFIMTVTNYNNTKFLTIQGKIENGTIVGTIQDITTIKALEDSKIEQQKLLNQQTKLAQMGEMIGNIAHQWRQPLSSISSIVSAFGIEYSVIGHTTQERVEEMTNVVIDSTNFLSDTIDTFSNFIKQKGQFIKAPLKVEIQKIINIISVSLNDNHITLNLDISDSIIIETNFHELNQVIINLINNSRDAFKDKKGMDKIITLSAIKEHGTVTIIVEDNAGGIPEYIIDKIFEPYFTTKHQSQGTGIGLYMSHRIITESLKGLINVENTDSGVKFIIKIPEVNDMILIK